MIINIAKGPLFYIRIYKLFLIYNSNRGFLTGCEDEV